MNPEVPPQSGLNVSDLPIPVPSFLEGNPYFSAGFGLAILGFGLTVSKRIGTGLQLFATRQFLTTLEISNRDPSFPWILHWLQTTTLNKTRRVTVSTTKRQTQSGKSITNFELVPSQGKHFIRYNNTFLMIERDRELRARGGEQGSNVWETLKFTTIGRNPLIYQNLMKDAQMLATIKDHDYTTIYTSWGHNGWKPFGNPRKKRDITSVILDNGISEIIINDVYEFLTNRQWYHQRGIPYRRGYLLYGEPGSGKSSFVTALAGHIGYDICIMSLAQPGLTDDHLAISLINIPEKSVILFEDVDCLFSDRGIDMIDNNIINENDENDNNLDENNINYYDKYSSLNSISSSSSVRRNDHNYMTFSGFLNALDGVSAGEERLVFMTTNHVNKLDPALIRPGRVDNMQYLGAATDYQIKKMFHRFYPEKDIGNIDIYPKFKQIHEKYTNIDKKENDQKKEKDFTIIASSTMNQINDITTNQQNKIENNIEIDTDIDIELLSEYTKLKAQFDSEIDSFVNTISGNGISMAELQEYFLLHKHNANTALEDAKIFVDTLLKSPRRKGKSIRKHIVTLQPNDINNHEKTDNNPHFSEMDLNMSSIRHDD